MMLCAQTIPSVDESEDYVRQAAANWILKKNVRSKKILERLGVHLEAMLKNNRINPQTKQISDTLVYAMHHLDRLPALFVQWGESGLLLND